MSGFTVWVLRSELACLRARWPWPRADSFLSFSGAGYAGYPGEALELYPGIGVYLQRSHVPRLFFFCILLLFFLSVCTTTFSTTKTQTFTFIFVLYNVVQLCTWFSLRTIKLLSSVSQPEKLSVNCELEPVRNTNNSRAPSYYKLL